MALTKVDSILVDGAINTTAAGNVGIGISTVATSGSRRVVQVTNGSNGGMLLLGNAAVENGSPRIFTSGTIDLGLAAGVTTGIIQLFTNDTERMRIDSSGRLLVNTPSIPTVNNASVGIVQSYTSDSNSTAVGDQRTALVLRGEGGGSNNSGAYSCLVLSINQGLANNPGVMLRGYGGNGGTTYSLQINGNGNITNSNNSYGSLSDFKLKENIVDATPKLEDVMRLQVRNFNFKKSLGYEDNKQIGFVAQEFENVFPGLVESVSKDDSGEDDANIKSIKTSVLVPILVKAIQEQQAIITDLKARIETLEAK
jgi:hypothetical protein